MNVACFFCVGMFLHFFLILLTCIVKYSSYENFRANYQKIIHTHTCTHIHTHTNLFMFPVWYYSMQKNIDMSNHLYIERPWHPHGSAMQECSTVLCTYWAPVLFSTQHMESFVVLYSTSALQTTHADVKNLQANKAALICCETRHWTERAVQVIEEKLLMCMSQAVAILFVPWNAQFTLISFAMPILYHLVTSFEFNTTAAR